MKRVRHAQEAKSHCDAAATMLEYASKLEGRKWRSERRDAHRFARKYLGRAQEKIGEVLRQLEEEGAR